MQRVMIIGQPGSGKSTLARLLAEQTFLPIVHMDQIHWQSGWIERDRAEKHRLTLEAMNQPSWIFEGGFSATWPQRLERADALIWLDLPLGLRLFRVLWRTIRYAGQTRPDLPKGCPERFSAEFLGFIWRTRHTARAKMADFYAGAPADKAKYHLQSPQAVRAFLGDLKAAVSVGNLGIPNR